MNKIRYLLLGVMCLTALSVWAQWQWTDKDGRKVFSDRAPPTDIPEKNILKRPGQFAANHRAGPASAASAASDSAQGAAAPAPEMVASAARPSGVDKELADKKRKAQEAESARIKAEQERILKARVENCARAKQAKISLDSNRRISRFNEKGEPEVLDSAARAAEMVRVQSIIDADCR